LHAAWETITIRNKVNKTIYSNIIKRICFKHDEEKVHNFFLNIGKIMESNLLSKNFIKMIFNYQDKILEQDLFGIKFRNPVGLSAGFDKNAELISIMEDIGFGFVEVGSITAKPCKGNKGKRLLRIPEKNSIWVNLGLNNNGSDEISLRLKEKEFKIPFGISVAKTNCEETTITNEGIKDYIYTLKKFNNIGDYFTINISCPNAYGGQPFSDPKVYSLLLKEIKILEIKKPIFIKLSPDLDKDTINKILNISQEYGIKGFICSNLTKKDINFDKGGLSGKELSNKSDLILSHVYKQTRKWKNKPILIGVGGIFSPEDVYRKIALGANLVQLITGMIFNGPGIIGEINFGLSKLLRTNGFSNIEQAVGSAYSNNGGNKNEKIEIKH